VRKYHLYHILLSVYLLGACHEISTTENRKIWKEKDRAFLVSQLASTSDTLVALTSGLSSVQWRYSSDGNRWNIGQVVTHLVIHDALFYREIKASTSLPMPHIIPDSLLDEDNDIIPYANVTKDNSGKAPWYLKPDHRWSNQKATLQEFLQIREAYIQFIQKTNTNLRGYYSSNGRGKKPYRDLHQLTLVSIAHTKRHLVQIRGIIDEPEFPK